MGYKSVILIAVVSVVAIIMGVGAFMEYLKNVSGVLEFPNFATVTPDKILPEINANIIKVKETIDHIVSIKKPTWDNSIGVLAEAESQLFKTWHLIEHLDSVHSDTYNKVYSDALKIVTEFNTEKMQNEKLYNIFLALQDAPEFKKLNIARQNIIRHAIRDFKLAGVALPQDKRDRFKAIVQELSTLSNTFNQNIIKSKQLFSYYTENAAEVESLPEHIKSFANKLAKEQNKTGWVFTLDQPVYIAIMTYAEDRALRQKFYEAYTTRASQYDPKQVEFDNSPIINKILQLRQEKAELLGFKNYAEVSLATKMAKDPQEIKEFLYNLINASHTAARSDFKQIEELAEKSGISKVEPWDVAFYAEKLKKSLYDITEDELRPYFPLNQVLDGMFKLVDNLYGITLVEVDGKDFTKWDDHVRLFKVYDKDGRARGAFYLDLYTGKDKRNGAWMEIYNLRFLHKNNVLELPIAFLEANFTPPTNDVPSLLSHDEITTLFHEFGHTLHDVLTIVNDPDAAGVAGVEWDAVELPSQFMENWCWEWSVIRDLSKHYKTGEHLPEEIFKKLLASKNFEAGMFLARQLEFGLYDLRVHAKFPEDAGLNEQQILDKVRAEVAVVPVAPYNKFQNSFSHIYSGGYAAGYYSYLWAEVLSSDAFMKFKEDGNWALTGKEFLEAILERGGSEPAMDLFIKFRNRKPDPRALLESYGIKG